MGGSYGKIPKHRHPRHARGDLFEQLQPLRGEAEFIRGKPGGVPAWARQAIDEAHGDRVADVREDDRHGAAYLPQCLNAWGGRGKMTSGASARSSSAYL